MNQGDIYVGMEVRLVEAAEGEHYRLNSNHRYRLNRDHRLRITAVHHTTQGVVARSMEKIYNHWNGRDEEMSFAFANIQLEQFDPNAPAPRKLGKKPEGDEFIDIDHPGIQWLWDDMGKYADEQGYCNQYDALCVKLGIPGRPRDFTVTKTIGDIPISATVKARSQREANEMVEKALQGRLPDLEETPATQAA